MKGNGQNERMWRKARPTRADAETFALCVASKLERGITVTGLLDGNKIEGDWFALCPPVLRCGITACVEKAEGMGHAFILEEYLAHKGRVQDTTFSTRHWRVYYDFENGRLNMAKIRKLNEKKKAAAAGVKPKAKAKAKVEAKPKAKAAPKAKAKGSKKAERPVATLLLQRSIGGMLIGELQFADGGAVKYFVRRKNITQLLDEYRHSYGSKLAITKVDAKAAALTAEEKAELKAWGSFK